MTRRHGVGFAVMPIDTAPAWIRPIHSGSTSPAWSFLLYRPKSSATPLGFWLVAVSADKKKLFVWAQQERKKFKFFPRGFRVPLWQTESSHATFVLAEKVPPSPGPYIAADVVVVVVAAAAAAAAAALLRMFAF